PRIGRGPAEQPAARLARPQGRGTGRSAGRSAGRSTGRGGSAGGEGAGGRGGQEGERGGGEGEGGGGKGGGHGGSCPRAAAGDAGAHQGRPGGHAEAAGLGHPGLVAPVPVPPFRGAVGLPGARRRHRRALRPAPDGRADSHPERRAAAHRAAARLPVALVPARRRVRAARLPHGL
ncbi:Protein of unknown function, partial [Gryllus bimaculatus]